MQDAQDQLELFLHSWLDQRVLAGERPDPARDDKALAKAVVRADRCLGLLDAIWPSGPPASRPSDGDDSDDFVTKGPDSFGRFQIKRLLGRGGMGNVFLAFDPVIQRELALKVPHPGILIDREARRRFRREARAAGVLRHPNIVPIYESGEVDGIHYIASEYCPGTTLTRWMRNESIDAPPLQSHTVATKILEEDDSSDEFQEPLLHPHSFFEAVAAPE